VLYDRMIYSPRALRSKAVQNADLVIEAIIENLKIKQDLFAFLDSKAK
jgi:3-hydroxyacyl-CoA dehydrogenase